MYLKSVICLFITSFSLTVFAQNQNSETKNIDLFATAGVFFLTDVKLDNATLNASKRDLGGEISLSGLYSFQQLGVVTPVIGAGIHSSHRLNKVINGVNFDHEWASLEANAGVKLNLSSWFNLITLANLGYAHFNKFMMSDKTFFNYNIKKHYYYGATVIGTVPLSSSVSVGAAFSLNNHSMKYGIDDSPITYNQYTTALVVQYSI